MCNKAAATIIFLFLLKEKRLKKKNISNVLRSRGAGDFPMS